MIVKVALLANQPLKNGQPVIREVHLPEQLTDDKEQILEQVFQYGQNHIQPVPNCCSVSVCDCVLLDNKYFLVDGSGFKEITKEKYEEMVEFLRASPENIYELRYKYLPFE